MAEGQRYRRRSLGALVGAGLFAPALLRAQPATELTPTERRLYDAAKAKQEQVTWYISHYSGETAEAIGRAFDEAFPGVKANVVRTTAQVAFQRLSQDMRARVHKCDVFSSTDIGHYVGLKEKGLLEKYMPDNAAQADRAAASNYDPDGYYHRHLGGADR